MCKRRIACPTGLFFRAVLWLIGGGAFAGQASADMLLQTFILKNSFGVTHAN